MNRWQRKAMEITKQPLTQEQMRQLKITPKLVISELKKVINYFRERDIYKITLRRYINKYGIVNMPKDVQRTIPTEMKVLYELPWWLHPVVWMRLVQIAYLNAHNECIRRILNV